MEEALEDLPSTAGSIVRKRKHSTRQAENEGPVLKSRTQCPESRTDEEIDATAALIDVCPEGWVLVGGHYPLLTATHGYTLTPDRQLRNAARLRTVLGESGRSILYLAGHAHRFSYAADPEYPNLQHLTTGAFFMTHAPSGLTGEFTRVDIAAEGLVVTHHTRSDAWHAEVVQPRSDGIVVA